MLQSLLTEVYVLFLEVEPNRVPIRVAGSNQRRAAPNKGVENKLPLVREEFDDLLRKRNGESRGMDTFVPHITGFVGELPYTQL